MSAPSEAEHILELSRELLDDIELSRLPTDKLLLKCSRLARLAGSEEVKSWIRFEMQGYVSGDPVSIAYMGKTGRWTKREENKGYWGPLAQHEGNLNSQKTKLAASKVDSISSEYAVAAIAAVARNQAAISTSISALSGILSRVIGLLHSFVSGVYYERHFADVAEETFEQYKRNVDGLIAQYAGDVLTKIPAVVGRLREGDGEAISQALTTCRRILEAFADAVYPPTDRTIELGGNTIRLDASRHQNRINAYIAERTASTSRRTKLRQNLGNLFDRVSTGVHNDVSSDEAFSLFLNVYLFLGEVLQLPKADGGSADTPGPAAPLSTD